MALRMFAQVPVMSPFSSSTNSGSGSVRLQPPCRVGHHSLSLRPLTEERKRKRSSLLLLTSIKAVEESQANSETGSESVSTESAESQPGELGMEIKKAMEERKKEEEEKEGLFSGVAEEVREIEWPVFGKVLGTTGVVLGVIAGSCVVLLTVNAVLAELSDQVFAGRGIQDFFG